LPSQRNPLHVKAGGVGGIERLTSPKRWAVGNESIICLARTNRLHSENQAMNDYAVTFANGEVVEVEAWTPEIAGVIAEEEADLNGRPLSVVSVELLRLQATQE
jgi:hypothetical protein